MTTNLHRNKINFSLTISKFHYKNNFNLYGKKRKKNTRIKLKYI